MMNIQVIGGRYSRKLLFMHEESVGVDELYDIYVELGGDDYKEKLEAAENRIADLENKIEELKSEAPE